MSGRADFAERREARVERYKNAATKASEDSLSAANTAYSIVERIPLGQPILVGHHSEKRARADAARIDNAMRRRVDSNDKAAYYADKAQTAESNTAIFSDDPDASGKLSEKIMSLESKQKTMKAVNAFYRKYKTCIGFEGITEEEARQLDDSMKQAYSWETAPFPSYELTSINNRIKTAKTRLEQLARVSDMPDEVIKFNNGEIHSDPETNRIIIRYNERQTGEVTSKLKRYGFKWSPTAQGWQRLRNPNALYAAKRICEIGRQPTNNV
jgi:hypothetical protein